MRADFNCPNCGAPITGDRCEYCGTSFLDLTTIDVNKPFPLKIRIGNRVSIVDAYVSHMDITPVVDTDSYRDISGRMFCRQRASYEIHVEFYTLGDVKSEVIG